METTVPTITTPITKCVRVNRQTKLTPMFGAAVGSGGSGGTGGTTPPDNSGGTGGTPERDCATYTVKEGDTLSSIATDFDIEGYYVDNVLFDGYQKIYQLNMETMKNENTIDVGQVLKMPGGDCLKDGQVAAPTPSGNGNGTAGSSVPCICPGEEGFEAIWNNKAGGAGAGEGDDEARRKLRTERRADIKTGRARAARWCFYGRMRVAPYRCSWRCTV